MIYRIFSLYHPLIVFITLIISILLWLYSFLKSGHPVLPQQGAFEMPFYQYISGLLTGNVLLMRVTAFFMILLQGFFLSHFNKRFIQCHLISQSMALKENA